jgi:hypothetical protein
MRKLGTCLGLVALATLLAALYGALHDQLTYTIAPKYYTRFKYEQFGFEPAWFGGDRPTVALIGTLATWWMGLFVGAVFALAGAICLRQAWLLPVVGRAIRWAFAVVAGAEIVGYAYGRLVLARTGVDWWLPEHLVYPADFITVGSMHNAAYLGGLLGLLAGVTYIIWRGRALRLAASS